MRPSSPPEALLLLEDGSRYRGHAPSPGTAFGEVVFNTSMTGYQEILTDPSYRGQIVVMTQPHIGNYGTRERVAESSRPWAEGFIARRFTARAPRHRAEEGLVDYLRRHGVPALAGIDTRALVRRLRDQGAMRGVLTTEVNDLDRLVAELERFPTMAGRALVDEVTCDAPYEVPPAAGGPLAGEPRHLAVYDFGAKASIAAQVARRGHRVTVLPARTSAQRCLALGVDGVVLSNGPGDPQPLVEIVAIVRRLIDSELPVFGICLGHQLLALALGARTYKLKFGHHGGNQPVQELATGRVAITSQNHGFAVDPDSLPATCRVTHRNLNDGTVEGLAVAGRPIFSVQYHPEAAPGPHESLELFDRFLARVAEQPSAQPAAG